MCAVFVACRLARATSRLTVPPIISDDREHTTGTVHAFIKIMLQDVKSFIPELTKVIYFSFQLWSSSAVQKLQKSEEPVPA